MVKLTVYTGVNTGAVGSFNMPEGKAWADVYDWYIKWDVIHIQWESSVEHYEEFELLSESENDWKRPTYVSIVNEEQIEVASD